MAALFRIGSLVTFGAGCFSYATATWTEGTLFIVLSFLASNRADLIDIKENLQ